MKHAIWIIIQIFSDICWTIAETVRPLLKTKQNPLNNNLVVI